MKCWRGNHQPLERKKQHRLSNAEVSTLTCKNVSIFDLQEKCESVMISGGPAGWVIVWHGKNFKVKIFPHSIIWLMSKFA